MIYRRRTGPLQSARAAAGCTYCLALGAAALVVSNPVVLGAVVVAVLVAGHAAGVGREVRRAAIFAFPAMVAIAVINALVTRDGLTVILRLGDLPVLGHADITLEATAYGAILGLRCVALILCGVLYTTAVDPDEVLRLFRRVSYRSALTATLATRMVPILIRDSRRLADAQRCRPGPAPSRLAHMRASTSSMLDRALDVAAALEVRGYGTARRPGRGGAVARAPLSRHDLAFGASAVAVVVIAALARWVPLAPFSAYPSLHVPAGAEAVAAAAALLVCALAPFLDRRGL
jgi:energy-coupling factor transport system permease protein